MSAIIECRQFLYNRLTHNAAVAALVGDRIYRTVVPINAQYPCILFAYIGSNDPGYAATAAVLAPRAPGTLTFVVRAVTIGTDPLAGDIAEAIEQCLVGASGTMTHYKVLTGKSVAPTEMMDKEQDTEYWYTGAEYAFDIARI